MSPLISESSSIGSVRDVSLAELSKLLEDAMAASLLALGSASACLFLDRLDMLSCSKLNIQVELICIDICTICKLYALPNKCYLLQRLFMLC